MKIKQIRRSVVSAIFPICVILTTLGSVQALLAEPCVDGPCAWAEWTVCVQQAQKRCQLAAGTYDVESTIEPADGTQLIGIGVQTWLRRKAPAGGGDPGFYPIIRVPSGRSAVIDGLLLDGNRWAFKNGPWYQSGFPAGGYFGGPPGQKGCTPPNYPLFDLEVQGAATILNSIFIYAPGHSVYLKSGLIAYSSIQYSRSTGLWLEGGTSGTASAIDNTFYYNGTAAVRTDGSYGWISWNYFHGNRYEMSDLAGGGQVYVNSTAHTNAITENVLYGMGWETSELFAMGCYPPWKQDGVADKLSVLPPPLNALAQWDPQSTYGIEVEPGSGSACAGSYCANMVLNNEISNHTGAGITVNSTAGSATDLLISGYDLYCSGCPARYIFGNVGEHKPFGIGAHGIDIGGENGGQNTRVELNTIRSVNNGRPTPSGIIYLPDVLLAPNVTGYGWAGYVLPPTTFTDRFVYRAPGGNHCILPYQAMPSVFSPGSAPTSTTTCP